jgi:Uri superfamily endonuclease
MCEPNKGTYALVLHLEGREEITVGKLGTFIFPAGYYLYVGSALGPGGLEARLARHRPSIRLRRAQSSRSGHRCRDKKLRWHIDYLLEHVQLVEVWSVASTDKLECLWAWAAQELPGSEIPVPGFGSSDCRCPSHLIRLARKPSFEKFTTKMANIQ